MLFSRLGDDEPPVRLEERSQFRPYSRNISEPFHSMFNLPKPPLDAQLKQIFAKYLFAQELGDSNDHADFIATKVGCLRVLQLDQRSIDFNAMVAACFDLIQRKLDPIREEQPQDDSQAVPVTVGMGPDQSTEFNQAAAGENHRPSFSRWLTSESFHHQNILGIAPQVDQVERPSKRFMKLYSFGTFNPRTQDAFPTPLSAAIDGWLNGLAIVACLRPRKSDPDCRFAELEFVWSILVRPEGWYREFGSPKQLHEFSSALNTATMGFCFSLNLPVVVQEFRLQSMSMARTSPNSPTTIAPLWSPNELERECKYILYAEPES